MNIKGKKLLILAGAPQHCKLVRAAKSMGVYTIVTDYLMDSPAKKICDKAYMIDVKDVPGIVDLCRCEQIDGVLSAYIDPCQIPYSEVCQQLQLPCYADPEQFRKMTNKRLFKQKCKEIGVEVIPEYTVDDIYRGNIDYPVFVKPIDGRGSRGQSICFDRSEIWAAIEFAKTISSNGEVIIEKYVQNAHEIQATYFFVDGKPHLIRLADDYPGSCERSMQRVTICGISPSKYTDSFLQNANSQILQLLQSLGIKNGPAFVQCFEKDGHYMLFDPGLRFPGEDFEIIYQKIFGVDFMKAMVGFALTGRFHDLHIPEDGVYLAGYKAATLFPTLKAGRLMKIYGENLLKTDKHIYSYHFRHQAGDEIEQTHDIEQRLGEVDVYGKDNADLADAIDKIQSALCVKDVKMQDMILEKFDTSLLLSGI